MATIRRHIIDIISDVADNIRSTTDIINYVHPVITANDASNFAINDYILVSDTPNVENVKILGITGNDITIDKTLNIPTSIQSNKPYFYFRKWLSMANELLQKGNAIGYNLQKYPSILLLLDIEEKREAQRENFFIGDDIKIFLLNNTLPNKNEDWRKENIFEPILIPLYDLFINSLRDNDNIKPYIPENGHIEHKYIERYFLGTADKNQNKVNDYVEAIELRFPQLPYRSETKC